MPMRRTTRLGVRGGAVALQLVLLLPATASASNSSSTYTPIPDARPGRVVPALRESLARLGLDYLDLFLVHWPVAADNPAGKAMLVELDMEGVRRGMEECHRLGLARSVGVNNFLAAKMERLLALAAVTGATQGAQEEGARGCATQGGEDADVQWRSG